MNSTFISIFIKTLKKSFTLRGRASRRELWQWYFTAFSALMMVVAPYLYDILYFNRTSTYIHYITIINVFLICCLYISSFSITIRRCHDLGYSGWLILLNCIPIINLFAALYLSFKAGNKETNKYGPVPIDQNLTGFDKVWLWTFLTIVVMEFIRQLLLIKQ